MLEVLSSSGALTDVIATGARLVEPDSRVMTGAIYPPPAGGLSLRTSDPEPMGGASMPSIVASAETLAYAVASGEMGDPRSFKRPVRVTVPRALPTDDVLIVRERRPDPATAAKKSTPPAVDAVFPWKAPQTLEVVEGGAFGQGAANGKANLAVLCATLDEVRQLASRAAEVASSVRAVLAPFIPSGTVAIFSGVGIAAIQVDLAAARGLRGQKVALPGPAQWSAKEPLSVPLGTSKVGLRWLAVGAERAWATAGTARPAPKPARTP
jgi:aconitate hydratase